MGSPKSECQSNHRWTQMNTDPTEGPENKVLSQVWILIEHAIGGMKRYTILVDRFHNHWENFQDDVIAVCAGLWNFSSLIKEQLYCYELGYTSCAE